MPFQGKTMNQTWENKKSETKKRKKNLRITGKKNVIKIHCEKEYLKKKYINEKRKDVSELNNPPKKENHRLKYNRKRMDTDEIPYHTKGYYYIRQL